MHMRSKSLAVAIALLVSVCSSSSWAAPPPTPTPTPTPLTTTSPTHVVINADSEEQFAVLTMAMSSVWIGAVIDTIRQVPIVGLLDDFWPDSDDDLDVDPEIALQRRWYLAAPAIMGTLAEYPQVGGVCLAGGRTEGRATVYAFSDKGVVAVDTVLSPIPLINMRLLPLAMPVLTKHAIAGDVDRTIAALTKGKRCLSTLHEGGEVRFSQKQFKVGNLHREQRQRLRFPCTDAAGAVSAASHFVDVLGARSRDAVHALPQPFTHVSIASFSSSLGNRAISAMQRLGYWLPGEGADTAVRRADAALVLFNRTKEGRPIDAEVRLRSGATEATVHLQIFDDTCSLNGIPSTWAPTKTKAGEEVATDELSTWRHVGDAWVPGPAPNIVNTRKAKK